MNNRKLVFLLLVVLVASCREKTIPTQNPLDVAQQTSMPDSVAMQLYEASGRYYDNQNYDSAVAVGEQALPLLHQKGMRDEEADELSILSVCYMRKSDYDKALHYAKACNAIDRESGDADRISTSLNTIGSIYVVARQPKEGLKYLRQALQFAEQEKSSYRIALTCGTLAETEFSLNHFDEAICYIDRAIQLERNDGREDKLRVRLSQKATILVGMGKQREAVETFDSIIPYFRTTGNRQSLAISLNKAGNALLGMSNSDGIDNEMRRKQERQAVEYFREAAQLCHVMGNPFNELQARHGLYQALWTQNPDSARIELELFNKMKDSLYSHASAETLARYNAEFGNDELQQENTMMRRSRVYIIILCIGLLLVAAALIVRQRRLAALQRKRLGEVTMTLDELKQKYELQSIDHGSTDTESRSEPSEEDKDFLEKTIKVITNQMDDKHVSVDDLAAALAMSTSQFRRRLAAITGETPQNYITNIRMQHARHLLETQHDPFILDVALRCGYDDQSSFTRAFKRFFGITPSEYIQKNRVDL